MIVKTQNTFELLSLHDFQCSVASAEMPVVDKKTSVRTAIKVQKSVCFDEDVRCITTLHVNDYTDKDHAQSWYQRHEFRNIKKEMANTAQLFASLTLKGDCDKYCFRGLENKAKLSAQRKRTCQMMAWAAVLDGQEDYCNPFIIAEAYTQAVQQCTADVRAYEKGLQDHTDAQDVNIQGKRKTKQTRKRKAQVSRIFGRSR